MTPSLVSFAPGPATALLPTLPALPRVLYALVLLAHAFRDRGSLFLHLFICSPAAANVEQFRRRGLQAECLELRRFRLSTKRLASSAGEADCFACEEQLLGSRAPLG